MWVLTFTPSYPDEITSIAWLTLDKAEACRDKLLSKNCIKGNLYSIDYEVM